MYTKEAAMRLQEKLVRAWARGEVSGINLSDEMSLTLVDTIIDLYDELDALRKRSEGATN